MRFRTRLRFVVPHRVWAAAAAVGVILGLQIAAAGPVDAADDVIFVGDSDKVTLTDADNGATATITLSNQTADPIDVSVTKGSGALGNCVIAAPDDHTLDGQRQQTFTFTFSDACHPYRSEGTNFTVTAGQSTFDLHADPPKTPDPNWGMIIGIFIGAALISGLVLWAAYGSWTKPTTRTSADGFDMVLPSLDSSWKFSDSWAANATVVTAAFAGVFGAKEVTTALLGEDAAKDLLAVALVTAAVAVGLVGASPMVLQALRKRLDAPEDVQQPANADLPRVKKIPPGLYVTPRGIVFAGFLTLTGTVGQLTSLLYQLMKTDFGNDTLIVGIGLVTAAAIYWYAWVATRQNLDNGAEPPKADPPTGKTITITLPAPSPAGPPGLDVNEDAEAVPPDQRVITIAVPEASAPTESKPSGIL